MGAGSPGSTAATSTGVGSSGMLSGRITLSSVQPQLGVAARHFRRPLHPETFRGMAAQVRSGRWAMYTNPPAANAVAEPNHHNLRMIAPRSNE